MTVLERPSIFCCIVVQGHQAMVKIFELELLMRRSKPDGRISQINLVLASKFMAITATKVVGIPALVAVGIDLVIICKR